MSRYLGIATIIPPAVAILNAERAIKVHYFLNFISPGAWLLILMVLFYLLVRHDLAGKYYSQLADRYGKRKTAILVLLIVLFLGLILPGIIRLSLIGGKNDTPLSLSYLSLHLILLAFAFYIFVSTRSSIFDNDSWLGTKIGWPVILAGGTLAILFILLNAFPLFVLSLDKPYLSLPALLSGIVFYIITLTLLTRIGLWQRINVVLIIFVIGLVIAITVNNNFHVVTVKKETTAPSSVPMTGYFRQWLLARKDEIDSTRGAYPVFLVNAYGGGIRAAAFTNMVITYLDSIMLKKDKEHKAFEHYVFSISGASGGTIGAAVQCAYRARYLDRDTSGSKYSIDTFINFYSHDFLTPVLTTMIGRDVWASATSTHFWKDRSAIQENLWIGFGAKTLNLQLDDEFNTLWNTSTANPARYEVPLLFSNTLNVDDGLKGIMAPVELEHRDFPATIFIREKINDLQTAKDSPLSVSLMTGAFLSARFPFISASGKIGAGYHFMDGGGKDNSGASTSEDIFISLVRFGTNQQKQRSDSTFSRLMQKVRFYFISISNSGYIDPDSTRRLVSNRFEPISPLVGIINSGIDGNARAADSTLQFRYTGDSSRLLCLSSDYCSIWPTGKTLLDQNGDSYMPVLPLGWQISSPSLLRLRLSFTDSMIRDFNNMGLKKILAIPR
jgi:hypothetical protein